MVKIKDEIIEDEQDDDKIEDEPVNCNLQNKKETKHSNNNKDGGLHEYLTKQHDSSSNIPE